MPDKILHKRSLTPGSVPTTQSLSVGELAINVADRRLYTTSGSTVIVLNDNTGSFSGSFIGTASFATTASAATSITFTPSTASFSTTSSYVLPNGLPNGTVSSSIQISYTQISNVSPGIVSSSGQVTSLLPNGTISSSTQVDYNSIQNKPTTIATASYIDYTNVANKPSLVSSSVQINTGSFTGSFTGNIFGNAVSASAINATGNITQVSQSSATASFNYVEIPSTTATTAFSTKGRILYSNFFSNVASLPAATEYHGMFTHVHSEGGAYYSHGSNGWVKLWDQFNVPVLVSSSGQFTNLSAPFTGSFTGSFKGDGSGLTGIVASGTLSSSAQVVNLIAGQEIAPRSISGSYITASGIDLHGYLELYPVTSNISSIANNAYFYISGSGAGGDQDLWYTHDLDNINFRWIEGALETGLLYGGIGGFSGSSVYLREGAGIIVTHNGTTTAVPNPTVNYVKWPATTASIDITNGFVTYLSIGASGQIISSSTKFSPADYHDIIPLGAVGHFNQQAIIAKGEQINTQYSQIAQITDFARNFGPIKVGGYGINAQSGSLKFSRTAGDAFIYGGFYSQNPETPSNYQSTAVNTGSFGYVFRTGSAQGYAIDSNNNTFYQNVRVGFYDTGNGTGSLASNEWSIQRVFLEPVTGIHYIYYGQTKYTSLANALSNLTVDSFAEGPATTLFTVFIGYIIAKGDTTNLADTTNNSIISAGLFRNTSAGSVGGGAASQLLNDLSDVTITSPSNGQALIYSSGDWVNGTPTNATSASFATNATSASYAPAPVVSFADITGKPTLVSSSLQFNTFSAPFTGSFTGSFSGNGSNITGVVSASYAYNTTNTGRKIVNSISFINGERIELQNIDGTISEIDTGLRTEVNLTNVDFIQVSARVERGTNSDSELRIQYSTDEITWNNLTTVTGVNAGARVDLITAGTILTSELAIASGAKTTVVLRLVTTAGSGLSAQLGNVVLHTIYQL